jgi:RNA polymerase sigma factor (sigma-70 family)
MVETVFKRKALPNWLARIDSSSPCFGAVDYAGWDGMDKEIGKSESSERGFEELVEQYHRLVISLVRRYYSGAFADRAEDLSQEVWVKLWEAFEKNNQKKNDEKNEKKILNFKSYLYKTVQTTMWDAMRRLERAPAETPIDNAMAEIADDDRERRERTRHLDQLIERLKDDEARMVRAYMQGFDNGEIAMLCGCSEGRVRNLLTRIKKKLAELGGQ